MTVGRRTGDMGGGGAVEELQEGMASLLEGGLGWREVGGWGLTARSSGSANGGVEARVRVAGLGSIVYRQGEGKRSGAWSRGC
jgi:hypothetical protein